MERHGEGLRRSVFQMLSSLVWICLLGSWEIPGVMSKECFYKRSKYNYLTHRYDKVITVRECQWQCCHVEGTDPCCSAPITVIVSGTLGGLLGLVVLLLCCVFLRQRYRQRRSGRQTHGQSHRQPQTTSIRLDSPPPAAHNGPVVVFQTETSGSGRSGDHHNEDYDPPPSYEEVIRGEDNYGFKSDTS